MTLRQHLPDGRVIDDQQFEGRHRLITSVLLVHAPGLVIVGLVAGYAWWHTLLEVAPVLALAGMAHAPLHRLPRSIASCLGLVMAAATLVHFTGGMVEAHFHWFVVLSLAALYNDLRPFVTAVAATAAHHAGMSLYDPSLVFEHQRGQENPFLWTGVHVFFVVLLIGALTVNWYTLQIQHQRWLESARQQQELLDRQAALADESAALARAHEQSLDLRKKEVNELARRSSELARVSGAARETITSTSAAMEAMTGSASRVSDLVGQVVALARQADSETSATQEAVNDLESQSRRIAEMVELIAAIASKTNLLALNATIEAERAGETGRGFAVVATEVKSLAQRTSEATTQVRSITDEIQTKIHDSSARVAGVAELMRSITERQDDVETQMDLQRQSVTQTTTDVETAGGTILEVIQGIEELNRSARATANANANANDEG